MDAPTENSTPDVINDEQVNMTDEKTTTEPTPEITQSEKILEPTSHKPSKKLITIAIVSGLILAITLGVSAYVIINNKQKNKAKSEELAQGTPTPSDTPTPSVEITNTITPTALPTNTSNIVKYKDFTIKYSGKPEVIKTFKVFEQDDKNEEFQTKYSYTMYKVGEVAEAVYKGYDVIYAFDEHYFPYNIGFFGPSANFLIIFSKDNQKVVLNNTEYDINKIFDKSGTNTFKAMVNEDLYDFFRKGFVDDKYSDSAGQIVENYDNSKFELMGEAEDDTNLYLEKSNFRQSSVYTKSPSGFFVEHLTHPYFASNINGSASPKVIWKDTNKLNTTAYNFGKPGVCSVTGINGVDVKTADLMVSGSVSGTKEEILEPIDPNKDQLTKDLYNIDYIEAEMYKYNETTADDVKPFTFVQYAKMHPVFYWKDPFGRYIGFVNNEFLMIGGCGKPVVYLYPERETVINTKIDIKGSLTLTIPHYTPSGWTVTARPNGDLTDTNGNKYDYLFWEGQTYIQFTDLDTGWVIKKSEVPNFLNNKLTELGFNEKEKAQFIEYWQPKMLAESSEYIYINFVDESVMNVVAPLTFSQKPDVMKRYFMEFKGEDKIRNVKAPKFKLFERKGFTVFEWGGTKLINN
jgi:hypothetical protein